MSNFTIYQAAMASPLVISAVILDQTGKAVDLTGATAPNVVLLRDGKAIGGKAATIVEASAGIVGASFEPAELQAYGAGIIIYRIQAASYPAITGAIKLS